MELEKKNLNKIQIGNQKVHVNRPKYQRNEGLVVNGSK